MRTKSKILDRQLILCIAGGVQFAIEATNIQGVAEGDWMPPKDPQETEEDEKRDRVFHLSGLLTLGPTIGNRTLILKTTQGLFGVVVDSIEKEEFVPHVIKPVPPIMQNWLSPPLILGFALDEENKKVTNILDIQTLIELVACNQLPQIHREKLQQ